MFNGIPSISELVSTPKEWHTIWTGFCHSFYKPRYMPLPVWRDIEDEYHYYSTGKLVGQIVKVVVSITAGVIIIKRCRK